MTDIHDIFNSKEFISNYQSYCSKNYSKFTEFDNFLVNISIDRFDIKTKSTIVKNVKNENKDHNFNSYLNKLSEHNIDSICKNILSSISNDTEKYFILLNNILNYCIIQYNYCDIYTQLIIKIFENNDINYKLEIKNFIDNYKLPTFYENNDEYFTENNTLLKKLFGYSCLVACCEKYEITTKVKSIFDLMISNYHENLNNDIKYKYIQSIYIIMKELYSNNSLPKEYNDILNNLLTKEKYPKCKFKIMDTIERK